MLGRLFRCRLTGRTVLVEQEAWDSSTLMVIVVYHFIGEELSWSMPKLFFRLRFKEVK